MPFSRRTLLGIAALALLPVLAGCPAPPPDSAGGTTGGTTGAAAPATGGGAGGAGGSLTIKGSDTLLPLAKSWVEEFQKENPGANITVSGGGSGQGISALINGTTDIADASRKIEDKETAQAKSKGIDVKEVAVAMDGITIVVNPKNPIKSITVPQLADIYTGKVKNWKEIGGPDLKIVANGRDTSSGTYKYFQEEILKKKDYRADMVSNNANNAIASNVGQNEGAIGYIGVAYAAEFTKAGTVKEIPVSFAPGQTPLLPTPDNVHSGKYPISRALYNYVGGEPKGMAKAYLDYVTSDKGQEIVKKEGFITLK